MASSPPFIGNDAMITAVLLGPAVIAVLSLILVVTARIEHRLAAPPPTEEEAPEHAH